MQARGGRRGSVFSVRLTDEERVRLELMRRRLGGPRAMGPWLVWRASLGNTAPADLGITGSSGVIGGFQRKNRGSVLPARASSGTTASMGGTTRPGARIRLILDLCGGSGAWSEPYRQATGYEVKVVTLPAEDVRTYVPPRTRVHGVLAAPPCTEFSIAKSTAPRQIEQGLEVVGACLRIIAAVKPVWWALENPVGLLARWLGPPVERFDPCDFGDPWTKPTALWGDFSPIARGPFVKPLGNGPFCSICDPQRKRLEWCRNAAHRAITPPGFARAFFEANP